MIEHLEATPSASRGSSPAVSSMIVKFTAHDSTSSIDRAQYSVDGREWTLLSPTGNVSDSAAENYEFTLSGLDPGEHTIAVRAYDRFENVGSAKTTIGGSATKQ